MVVFEDGCETAVSLDVVLVVCVRGCSLVGNVCFAFCVVVGIMVCGVCAGSVLQAVIFEEAVDEEGGSTATG